MNVQQFLRNVCIVATFGCGLVSGAGADERVTSLPSETPATFTPSNASSSTTSSAKR